MKTKIVPVLIFCMVLPWIVSRVFHVEGHQEITQEQCKESFHPESLPGSNIETDDLLIDYEGLSTKQIIYLIP